MQEANDRFLILARHSTKATSALCRALAPLGRVVVVTDQAEQISAPSDYFTPRASEIIHVSDKLAAGFGGMMSVSGAFPRLTAWSRAFAYLSEAPCMNQAVWFFEDDVAGDADSLARFVNATKAHQPDLAAIDIRTMPMDPRWSWWRYAEGFFPNPAAAFQPLCRLSGRMVSAALHFQKIHSQMTFHEVLFASLAKQMGLKCLSWDRSAEFRYLLRSFRYRPEVTVCTHGISHPVKSLDTHVAICELPAAELPRKCSASLGTWTILSDDYDFLARFCLRNNVRFVAEFGPGDSTLAFLDAGCRVLSFEHDRTWLNRARARFEGETSVRVVHYDEGQIPLPEVMEFKPELVFVDGPPSREGQVHPRLEQCMWGLKKCGLVILHDTLRGGERTTLAFLETQQVTIISIPTKKGLAVIVDAKHRPECLYWNFPGL